MKQTTVLRKDEVLDQLAQKANVAQFVSFSPSLEQRFAWIHGYTPNYEFESVQSAIQALLCAAPDKTVNVRSFNEDTKSRDFIYGLGAVHDVLREVKRLAESGLFTIVNETIDVNDGGVSGVAFAEMLEFAPGDTPRCVEKPGTASFPQNIGINLIKQVYEFEPDLPYDPTVRVEFSIHPINRGYQHKHTIIWELEEIGNIKLKPEIRWPNNLSRFMGDKAYGLLVAHTLGLPVPQTTVIPRKLAPFSFGQSTETQEIWIRTCPTEQVPGKFTTRRGWLDPFKLLLQEDPQGTMIASVLAQESVEASYSGALVATTNGAPIIEGVKGRGDVFMQGRLTPERLPNKVLNAVHDLYVKAKSYLGPVRFEWVFDEKRAWIVQLHQGATVSSGRTIYPGKASRYHKFSVTEGIDQLRFLISKVDGTRDGIIVKGDIGITSHIGDLLRKAKIPSRIEF